MPRLGDRALRAGLARVRHLHAEAQRRGVIRPETRSAHIYHSLTILRMRCRIGDLGFAPFLRPIRFIS